MKRRFFATAILATLAASPAQAATPSEACLQDLRALPGFLLENDTGARQHLAQKGPAYFDQALASASEAAARANDEDACNVALSEYLGKWRKGHLQIVPNRGLRLNKASSNTTPKAIIPDRAPSLQLLSSHTALLTLPSFFPQYAKDIADLLESKRDELASRPNWIIDVRRNNGGSDSSYAPLLPWIASGERVNIGGEWLSTPANIANQEDLRTARPRRRQLHQLHGADRHPHAQRAAGPVRGAERSRACQLCGVFRRGSTAGTGGVTDIKKACGKNSAAGFF